jgi:P4 family phage/plasmid primase-like protien
MAVEFRGTGSQAVVPPSTHSSGEVREWEGSEIGEPARIECQALYDAVERLALACGAYAAGKKRKKTKPPKQHGKIAAPLSNIEAAREFAATADPAISGECGHKLAFFVACRLTGKFLLNKEQAIAVFTDVYNPRCQPPWSAADIEHKIDDAIKEGPDAPDDKPNSAADVGGVRVVPGSVAGAAIATALFEGGDPVLVGLPKHYHKTVEFHEVGGTVINTTLADILTNDIAEMKLLAGDEKQTFQVYTLAGKMERVRDDTARRETDPQRLADDVMDAIDAKGEVWCRHQGQWYVWDSQYYEQRDVELIEDDITTVIDESFKREYMLKDKGLRFAIRMEADPGERQKLEKALDELTVTPYQIVHGSTTMKKLRPSVSSRLTTEIGWIGDSPWSHWDPDAVLVCRNGLLHLPDRTLAPLTPQFFTRNGIDYDYDPNAPQPTKWLKFLDQIFPGDKESIDTLQKIFGYLLTPDNSQQKIFMFIGASRGGKGTIIHVLNKLIGEHNTASPSLTQFSERFGLEGLLGKTLCTFTDARRVSGRYTTPAVATERLLRISGGDSVDVEPKSLKVKTNVKLLVRFIIVSNCIPGLPDEAAVLARRMIALAFNQDFTGHENPTLGDELCEELPGILNWAIEGWNKLQEAGRFEQPKSGKPIIDKLTAAQNNVVAFVEERCYFEPTAFVSKKQLYTEYAQWCAASGYDKRCAKREFYERLRDAAKALKKPELEESREGKTQDRGPRGYKGMGLREADDE